MKEKVENALAKIRPLLQADGGDVQLVSVDEKTGIVKVRLSGACGCCPAAMGTLRFVVEKKIKEEVPEVKSVVPA